MKPPAPIPPLSPYGTFHGTLFQYSASPSLVAFESSSPLSEAVSSSSSPPPPNKCVLLGGLSDGLIPTPYTADLEKACHGLGWSLVQPIISSSYLGFGNGSLDRDTQELCALMRYLVCHRNADKFAIVGHSTGCQNAVHFVKHGDEDLVQKTKMIALQGPVSDREGAMMAHETYQQNIQQARDLASAGKENEMMPRDAFWAPITASRFLSLQDFGGADDFFSSDLSNDDLVDRLSHIGTCGSDDNHGLYLLAAFSGKDEYVPEHVDKDLLVDRMCRAMNSGCPEGSSSRQVATPLMLKTGNHNLSNQENDSAVFVQAVAEQLKLAVPSSDH